MVRAVRVAGGRLAQKIPSKKQKKIAYYFKIIISPAKTVIWRRS
jgi:hypothetical protein